MCEGKKREENERWKKEMEEISAEDQVWGIVNRKKRDGKGVMRISRWKRRNILRDCWGK